MEKKKNYPIFFIILEPKQNPNKPKVPKCIFGLNQAVKNMFG